MIQLFILFSGLISTHLHLIEPNYSNYDRSRLHFTKIVYVLHLISARNSCPCMDVPRDDPIKSPKIHDENNDDDLDLNKSFSL